MSGCGCGGKCDGARALRGFAGLPPLRLGLGALPAAFTGAQSDLQTLVAAPISTGDSLLASGNTATALTNYQTAGQNGATVVGPEIDLAGLPNATQPFTQQAWTINTALATTTDAPTAQALAKQILLLYQQAVAAATAASNSPNPNAIPGTIVLSPVVAALGGGLGVGLLWHLFIQQRAR